MSTTAADPRCPRWTRTQARIVLAALLLWTLWSLFALYWPRSGVSPAHVEGESTIGFRVNDKPLLMSRSSLAGLNAIENVASYFFLLTSDFPGHLAEEFFRRTHRARRSDTSPRA